MIVTIFQMSDWNTTEVCLSREPAGDWFWDTDDDHHLPAGPFPTEEQARADALLNGGPGVNAASFVVADA